MTDEKKNGETMALAKVDFGEVFVRVGPNGQILKPIKVSMALFEKLGHIYEIKKGRFAITAAGYSHLNKVAGITILSPGSVIVDGRAQPNPYVERDKQTHVVKSVIVRKIGLGYTPMGVLVAIDKTLYYSTYAYWIQSIQAKMKKEEWEGGRATGKKIYPDAAVVGEASKKPERPGAWVFFPIEKPLGLWINYEDQAIADCLEEHTQRQRFGDRIAQRIVERNILKDHPAIASSQVAPKTLSEGRGNVAYVTVHGFRHEMDYGDLQDAISAAEHGEGAVQAEVITEADAEEEKEVLHEVAEEAAPDKADEKSAAQPDLFAGKRSKK